MNKIEYYFKDIINLLKSFNDSTKYCNPEGISSCIIYKDQHILSKNKSCRLYEAIEYLKKFNSDLPID